MLNNLFSLRILKLFCLLVEPWDGIFALQGLFQATFLFPTLGICLILFQKKFNALKLVQGRGGGGGDCRIDSCIVLDCLIQISEYNQNILGFNIMDNLITFPSCYKQQLQPINILWLLSLFLYHALSESLLVSFIYSVILQLFSRLCFCK